MINYKGCMECQGLRHKQPRTSCKIVDTTLRLEEMRGGRG